MKDSQMIIGMIKKNNQTENVKVEKKMNINFWINKIIDHLKSRDNFSYLQDLLNEYKDLENYIASNREFFEHLNKTNKIFFDSVKNTLQLKSKYDIKNKEELKEKIKFSEYGLVEDDELLDSYPGIKNDLEKIKQENFVKVINNDEKKFNVLFYRDCSDKIEQITIDPNYQDALKELRKIWKDELNYFSEETNNLHRKRRSDNDNLRKKERKRKIKMVANSHLSISNISNPANKK